MSSADDVGAAAARAELTMAADLMARARREVAHGSAPAIEPLASLIATLERRLDTLPLVPADLRPAVPALLDEAARLAVELDVERRDLAARLRAIGVRRRAEVAYRRPPGGTS